MCAESLKSFTEHTSYDWDKEPMVPLPIISLLPFATLTLSSLPPSLSHSLLQGNRILSLNRFSVNGGRHVLSKAVTLHQHSDRTEGT